MVPGNFEITFDNHKDNGLEHEDPTSVSTIDQKTHKNR